MPDAPHLAWFHGQQSPSSPAELLMFPDYAEGADPHSAWEQSGTKNILTTLNTLARQQEQTQH